MKTIDIIIISDVKPTDNKLFKKVLVDNKFRDIPYKVVSFNRAISEIQTHKPKLVISMGEKTITDFNIPVLSMHDIVGKFIKSEDLKLFCTYSMEDVVHENDYICQYVNEHIKLVSDLYFKSKQVNTNTVQLDQSKVSNKCYSYQLPDWCYDENHILIDIQHNFFKKKLVFVFRDKDGNKKFHYENSKKKYFYVYPNNIKDSPMLMDISNVELHHAYTGLLEDTAIYDGDVNPEIKHSIDYYYNRTQPEPLYELKKLYWDIEVYTGNYKAFPFPLEAEHPINSISFKLDLTGKTHVYVLNYAGMDMESYKDDNYELQPNDNKKIEEYLNKNETINHYDIKVFNSEKELIEGFLNRVKELDPDLLAGWNTDFFDVPYLVNRMYKLGIDPDNLSPINETDININEYKKTTIYGLYFADQLVLYQKLTQNKEESYKLSTISQKVLGADKVAYEGTINTMYEGDLVKFILYSGTDTDLLAELEDNLNHIKLNFDIIKTCCTTWLRAETTTGMVDPLLLKFAKDRNKVCRDKVDNVREKFSGAYVLDPKVGLHKYVVDFDFKSLYPSIIRSFNLGPNTYKAKVDNDIAENYLYHFNNLPDKIDVKINPMMASYTIKIMTPDELKDFIESNNYILTINGCMLEQHDKELSFFYEVLTYLGDERDNVKKMLGDARQKYNSDTSLTEAEKLEVKILMNQFDNRQSTYKILANSLYGIIAQPFFRMFNIDIAKAVTSTGQEALKFSVLHLSNYMQNDDIDINSNFLNEFQNSSLPYIAYGDTDSMFVLLGDYLKTNKVI